MSRLALPLAFLVGCSAPALVAVDPEDAAFLAHTGDTGAPVWTSQAWAGDGTSVPGFTGDGGPATLAKLGWYVAGAARDAAGNVYIADSANERIRKVAPDGTISTFAGNGVSGYAGDGGPAVSARINWPTGIAVDAAGSVWFSDTENKVVRKVDTAGVISTVAKPGARPTALALDGRGGVYVTLSVRNQIVHVSAAGATRVVAGDGTYGFSGDGGRATLAQLATPNGLWLDARGNLLIVDSANHRIRRVTNGIITTIGGSGAAGFSGDGGPATAASMSPVFGVAVDSRGNVFFSDYSNNRIREIDTAGTIWTVAGDGSTAFTPGPVPADQSGYHWPGYLTITPQDELFFSDANLGVFRVRRE